MKVVRWLPLVLTVLSLAVLKTYPEGNNSRERNFAIGRFFACFIPGVKV